MVRSFIYLEPILGHYLGQCKKTNQFLQGRLLQLGTAKTAKSHSDSFDSAVLQESISILSPGSRCIHFQYCS
jgi:hypothetical protein